MSYHSHDHSSSSAHTSPGHRSSSSIDSEAQAKRRRKAGELALGTRSQGNASASNLSLPAGAPIRPRSTAPVTSPSSAQGSSSATRYRPILPAPAAPSRPKQEAPFAHGPTNLPPEPYRGEHPYVQKAPTLNIHRTAAERLPRLEARINRLEDAMEKYIDHRSNKALERSTIPGISGPSTPTGSGSSGNGTSHSKNSSSGSSSRSK